MCIDVFSQEQNPESTLEKADDPKTISASLAAEGWLKDVDNDNFEATWNNASGLFKKMVPKKQWISKLSNVRKVFGKVKDRKIIGTKYSTTLPGAPDGEYITIFYETNFENKKGAIETITPMLDNDSQWRVAGYYIK